VHTKITLLTYTLVTTMIMALLIPFLLNLVIASLSISGGSNLSAVNTEGHQQQQQQLFNDSYSEIAAEKVHRNNHHHYFPSAAVTALIRELENLVKNFEYSFDLDAKLVFPNDQIKQGIVSKYKSAQYTIDDLDYVLLGFKTRASDITIRVNSTKIDDDKTRVDVPLILAKNVKVTNDGLINLSYNQVDLGSIYCIYDKRTDKMTVHIPLIVTAKYI
jgi:hypothetical protein